MSYAGTNKGGTEAILAAEELVLTGEEGAPDTAQVLTHLRQSVDRLMGEAALWDPETAARAFVQARGDLPEAVHVLRAHRSTLPRLAVSEPIVPDDSEHTSLLRRVVPAHREPEGPQLLGRTPDYTARLLSDRDGVVPRLPVEDARPTPEGVAAEEFADRTPRRYSRWLAEQGVLADRSHEAAHDPEPFDLALQPVRLPADRSALLSAMAMAETGGLVSQWYRSILGPDGYADEKVTLGEVRHARTVIRVRHPHTGRPVGIGTIEFSECEAIAHLDSRGEDTSTFDVGYGIAVGSNERKAIAMAELDLGCHRAGDTPEGHALQQILMLTSDGLASNGFLEHLKLPHYVTFRSMLDRAAAAGEIANGGER